MRGIISYVLVLLTAAGCEVKSSNRLEKIAGEKKPNIVIFYVDDLGYADLSSYGAKGVVTPHVDQLARQGLKFTDAHSPASTGTSSRYSLLTGEYAFRNNTGILSGDAALVIDTAKLTTPKVLKRAGYRSGVVGKWYLGLGTGDLDWNAEVKPSGRGKVLEHYPFYTK